jgi:hypothetical protein
MLLLVQRFQRNQALQSDDLILHKTLPWACINELHLG